MLQQSKTDREFLAYPKNRIERNKRDSHEIFAFLNRIEVCEVTCNQLERFPRNHCDSHETFLNIPHNAIEVNIFTLSYKKFGRKPFSIFLH